MQLKNKRVLITGSTSGIGLACARVCAQAGATVVLHGLVDQAQAKSLTEEFKLNYSIECQVSRADLSDTQAIKAFCDQVITGLGGIDILVNNAGIQHVAPAHQFPEDKWQAIVAVNLTAVFMMSKYLLPAMQQQRWGRIINIASVHGLVASVNKVAYVTTKHGVIGMTKTIALENATQGITVNAICPGWADTELVEKQYTALAKEQQLEIEEAKKQLLQEKQPSLRFIEPEHIGELVVFLASDAAAGITGTSLPVDGGWVAI